MSNLQVGWQKKERKCEVGTMWSARRHEKNDTVRKRWWGVEPATFLLYIQNLVYMLNLVCLLEYAVPTWRTYFR